MTPIDRVPLFDFQVLQNLQQIQLLFLYHLNKLIDFEQSSQFVRYVLNLLFLCFRVHLLKFLLEWIFLDHSDLRKLSFRLFRFQYLQNSVHVYHQKTLLCPWLLKLFSLVGEKLKIEI